MAEYSDIHPIVSKRQLEEEERHRRGDYKPEIKIAENNCSETELNLKKIKLQILNWKEVTDDRLQNNEYFKYIFGKESLLSEEKRLFGQYKGRKAVLEGRKNKKLIQKSKKSTKGTK